MLLGAMEEETLNWIEELYAELMVRDDVILAQEDEIARLRDRVAVLEEVRAYTLPIEPRHRPAAEGLA